LKNNAGAPSTGAQKEQKTTVSSLSELSAIRFAEETRQTEITVYGDRDVLLAQYDSIAEIEAHENAEYVNLTVDYKLTDTVICRVLYRLTLANE
jgi:hypothetical protein